MQFPKDFIWGTATSAYQTEGNNTNTDWWEWEQNKKPGQNYPYESSGIACDSYNRYEEDFDLCKKLNNNAVRISIEWARIEPQMGFFDEKEIHHYKKVLQAAKDRNLQTFVTLHHFTNPLWFSKIGGWCNLKSPFYFSRYAKKCAKEFGNLIDVFLTINEPQVYTTMAYFRGMWPPCKKNPFKVLLVQVNLMRAHNRAFNTIKSVGPHMVGLVKNIMWFKGYKIPAKILYWLNCDFFLKPIKKHLDVIGVNYYFTNVIGRNGIENPQKPVSDMGWWINAEGLEHILLDLRRYKLPIYITENGVADSNDTLRKDFLHGMLTACARATYGGSHLRGYFYWSLIDNYEWHEGYWQKFGLIEIDRKHNLKRKPRKSALYYAKICKENKI